MAAHGQNFFFQNRKNACEIISDSESTGNSKIFWLFPCFHVGLRLTYRTMCLSSKMAELEICVVENGVFFGHFWFSVVFDPVFGRIRILIFPTFLTFEGLSFEWLNNEFIIKNGRVRNFAENRFSSFFCQVFGRIRIFFDSNLPNFLRALLLTV